MGRSPCCDKLGLKKGPWTPEEDQKLLAFIEEHGHGNWRALPSKAGLQRCGKSCRLRWTNYLRPDIKRGRFSLQEEQTIIQLHALLGNRSPCCDKLGLKKGPWTPEEDQKLLAFIEEHGHGNWRALPSKAGLQRCGKSCRLRWTNYLRPDIKRGRFSLQEEQTIIQLHALLGNRWSAIATHLPKRTDNEIKNYWNTHLKKRLTKMGIDPVTHKPKNDALVPVSDGGPQQSKNVATLSHIAQWESARLEAEARLVRQSKLRSNASSFLSSAAQSIDLQTQIIGPLSSTSSTAHHMISSTNTHQRWQTSWPSNHTPSEAIGIGIEIGIGVGAIEMDSPTSTLSFMGNGGVIEFMSNNNNNNSHGNNDTTNNNNNNYDYEHNQGMVKEEDEQEWNPLSYNDKGIRGGDDDENGRENRGFIEGFTELLLSTTTTTTTTTTAIATRISGSSVRQLEEDQDQGAYNNSGSSGTTTTSVSASDDYYEDNKNYWNSILNLVNSSPPHSPMF
ncbi:hypothetical protein KSS87_006966 [Heliosperma pusillum]|nr:hypothetical protein KSS87_006966 [Heliosperma pusillum]